MTSSASRLAASRRAESLVFQVLCGFVLLLLGFSTGCRSSDAHPTESPKYGSLFGAKLREALLHRDSDQLARRFERRRAVTIADSSLRSVGRAVLLPDDGVVVSDLVQRRVTLYASGGTLVRKIGAHGRSPGQYLTPSGLASYADGSIAILDFDPKRVSRFGGDGSLLGSFSYSPQFLSGQEIAIDRARDVLSVVGLSHGSQSYNPSSRLVHQFDSKGTFLRSVVPIPASIPPTMYAYLEPTASQASDGLYLALSCQNVVHRLDEAGSTTSIPLSSNSAFRGPQTEFKVVMDGPPSREQVDRFYLAYQDWRTHWTPVERIVVVGNTLLIQYQTFSPLRYTLDIWSLDGDDTPTLRDRLQTNLALVSSSPNGDLLFRENVDGKDSGPYTFVVFRMRPAR